ncbi:bifunctional riboflavin kinase/FAD synthetase [Pedobacter sp. SYSU D00535]|uniref:bifunctional riboflavin kinase/FAD synthetase n=1 Tax=Pedobacter sp. SYSU D00535 TaxID=2810308 RepID=UPI001A9621EC|nr:bifunctional riboflavin kinase/FAD synthetase [Pedobacter sp. SYSU D00535]
MKVYHHIDEFQKLENAVVTIGTFDGVHFGHKKIINRLTEVAAETGGESVILTFFPHPRMIINPQDASLKLLTTITEKAELLEQLRVDHLIITPFTRDFSNLSAETYIQQVLVEKIGTKRIIIGYDHRFGKDRQGDLSHLQKYAAEYGFEVEEIPEQDIHEVAVSSTQIRNALSKGDVQTAADFLGYPFYLTGKVIKGDRLGRQMGFPTANLLIEETYKLIPADGIYAVKVEVIDPKTPGSKSDLLDAMAYIGTRPTISGMTRNIEVNIFNFDQEIYRQYLKVYFYHFIREDKRFDSIDELKHQIQLDKEAVLDLLR